MVVEKTRFQELFRQSLQRASGHGVTQGSDLNESHEGTDGVPALPFLKHGKRSLEREKRK